MADLRYAVYLPDPDRDNETRVFVPGDAVPDWAAKQITNPNCWLGGVLPADENPKAAAPVRGKKA